MPRVKPSTTIVIDIVAAKVPKMLIKTGAVAVRARTFIRVHRKQRDPEFLLSERGCEPIIVMGRNGMPNHLKYRSRSASVLLK